MHHSGPISGVATAGRYIATAGYDNQLILWDADSRHAVARSLHDHLVNHCAFSSDGRWLASASSDYSARIWEVPSLRLKAALIGHRDDVDMAVFSPDDRLVATCALDRTLRIFDLSGQCLHVMHGHTGNVLSLVWSRDGRRLVSSSVDGTVREWDVASGRALRCHPLEGVRTDTVVIDGTGRIIAGDDRGRIVFIVEGQVTYCQAHRAGIKKIVHDETQGRLVTMSYDRTLAVWQMETETTMRELSRSSVPALVWPRSGALLEADRVAVGTFGSSYAVFDWRVNRWDLDGVVADRSLNAVTVAEDGVYTIGDAGVLCRDGVSMTELGSLCNFLLLAGQTLLTGGQLGQLLDARSGAVIYQHHSPLNCGTTFMRHGQLHAAIGTYTGEALVFAVDAYGQLAHVTNLKIYDNAIKGMSANDDHLFTACASTAVAWHDVTDLELIRLIPHAHERIANSCCLAGPSGFASVGRDLKLRIWEGDQEEVYQTPHSNSVKCICASEDRHVLMTGSYTGTLAGFDLRTRQWCSFVRPTAAGISALAYDRRHGHFLASSYDGHLYTVQ